MPPTEQQPPTAGVPAAEKSSDLAAQVAAMLAALDGTPTAEHAPTYTVLQTRLQRALGDLEGD
jgi:hypothetical protein